MENRDLTVVCEYVAQLRRAGVSHVCISPGSRSTPLTMAFARHGGFQMWTLLDERSAGFFALGLARSSQTPVALVCTSGTAAGNYLPAVMEAYHTGVPLLLLTADRPPELYGTGSNQTADQRKLYGDYVKAYVEMPVPLDTPLLRQHARAAAWRLAASAMSVPKGPVHLNWPLREPLIPPRNEAHAGDDGGGLFHWWAPDWRVADAAVQATAELLAQAERPVFVCGPQDDAALPATLVRLASAIGAPVLADPLSQLRTGLAERDVIISHYDMYLRDEQVRAALRPDVIIRLGAPPTSKSLGQYLAGCSKARQVVVDVAIPWRDPWFCTTDVVTALPADFCARVWAQLSGSQISRADTWLARWRRVDGLAQQVVEEAFTGTEVLFEGRLFAELTDILPAGATLFVGNSMPVRYLDAYFSGRQDPLRVLANRGLSGIDGVVSTAAGVAAAGQGPVVLVIGDVSFYHDLNGLLAVTRHGLDLLVILVNNRGGGIFTFLPQHEYADTFTYFRTEHDVDFAAAVSAYGGAYHLAADWASLRAAACDALARGGLTVVELRTNAEADARWQAALHTRMKAAMADTGVLEATGDA